jgi:RNA polymerase sporulation-specific sigma factor
MARNKVEICGVDTSKLPVLKNPEMRVLFRELQAGDRSAREKLVNGNLRLTTVGNVSTTYFKLVVSG